MKKCESTFSFIEKLYEKHQELSTKYGCIIVGKFTNPSVVTDCLAAKEKLDEIRNALLGVYNVLCKNNQWLRMGPLELNWNKVHKGTLFGQGDRTWISPDPFPYDNGEFIFREHDGESKAEITLCSIGPNNSHKELISFEINENKKEKNKEQVVKKSFTNQKGRFLVIKLDSKSALNKLNYTIKIKGENNKTKKVSPVATVK